MPRFAYSARDRAGKSLSAELDAPTRKDALRILATRGLQVASVAELASAAPGGKGKAVKKAARASRAARTPAAEAPRVDERLPFLESLFDLISSGLSAGEAVRLLSVRIKEPRLRTLCGGLWERISEGAPLSRAMADFPQVFDTSITNLIQAGEATGSLNDTVQRLIAHLTEQRELRRKLLNSLAYPVTMVVVAGLLIIFFLTFLLPRLQKLLTSLGGKMPTSTAMMISVSNFAMSRYALVLGGIAVFAAISFWRWRATEAGRAQTDAWLLKLPLVGPFAVSQTVLSFSQTLSVLLENGITAAEALRMTEKQIQNRVHRNAFGTATARVLEGEALSVALTRTNCFPDLVLDRLAIGENTGNIVPSLKQIATGYQKVISNQLNAFTNVFATVVLMAVFVFVGFIAFAIVQAVFSVSASFKVGH